MRFTNITATAEAGIVIAGCPESTIDVVVFDNVTLELVQQTKIAGGVQGSAGKTFCFYRLTEPLLQGCTPYMCRRWVPGLPTWHEGHCGRCQYLSGAR